MTRFRKWLWLAMLVPIIMAGLGVWTVHNFGVRLTKYGPVARMLPAELAGAKQEGLPLTANDLRPNPPVPDSQNAAPIYRKVDTFFQALPMSEQEDDGKVTNLLHAERTNTDRAAARTILTRRSPEMRLAEQAATLPHCDFKRHWEKGPDLQLPEYRTARGLARLFAARAILESESGNIGEAFRSIHIGARIGWHMGEDPCLIALLVRVAIDSIMHRAFVLIMLDQMNRPDAVRPANRALMSFDPAPDMRHAFRSEIILGRVCVNIVRSGTGVPSFVPPALRSRIASSRIREEMTDAWEARMFQYWRPVFRALRLHKDDLMASYRRLKSLGDANEAMDGQPTYELNAVLMPVFSQAVLKVARNEAERRLRGTLLQIIEYHQRTGQFPDSLDKLSPAPPPDIFTGRPLIYRKTAEGFILYSVGEDFKDDGGKAKADKKGDPPPDIVVQYPIR